MTITGWSAHGAEGISKMQAYKLLKRMRVLAGMTQSECGWVIGYSGKQAIWRKESQRSPTSLRDITTLSELTGIPIRATANGEWTFK